MNVYVLSKIISLDNLIQHKVIGVYSSREDAELNALKLEKYKIDGPFVVQNNSLILKPKIDPIMPNINQDPLFPDLKKDPFFN